MRNCVSSLSFYFLICGQLPHLSYLKLVIYTCLEYGSCTSEKTKKEKIIRGGGGMVAVFVIFMDFLNS